MAEEEKKKPEEAEKAEPAEKKEEAPGGEKPPEDGKKGGEKTDDSTPLPQEIVLRVYMHCEGCARKVRRCLKGFEGVEDVMTDCRTSKVVVKGEKADPLKVLERVQRKSHRQVELISPIPKPPAKEPKEPEVKEVAKVEEKKEELPVITVALGVFMHCEACAQEIKKRIQRMKGVESAEPDLKSSQVIVKGAFQPEKLVDFINKRTGKHAMIIKVEPEKKKEEEKGKEGEEEKKAEEGEKEAKKGEDAGQLANKEAGDGADGGAGEQPAKPEANPEDPKLEIMKKEAYYNYILSHQVNPQRYAQEYYAYPEMFSDENPNACFVM